jgi:hypothetical protein
LEVEADIGCTTGPSLAASNTTLVVLDGTQRIRGSVTMVLDCQPVSALKRHPIQGTVSAAVHGLRRERAGEHTAHEDEILILAWPVVESFAKHQLLC